MDVPTLAAAMIKFCEFVGFTACNRSAPVSANLKPDQMFTNFNMRSPGRRAATRSRAPFHGQVLTNQAAPEVGKKIMREQGEGNNACRCWLTADISHAGACTAKPVKAGSAASFLPHAGGKYAGRAPVQHLVVAGSHHRAGRQDHVWRAQPPAVHWEPG